MQFWDNGVKITLQVTVYRSDRFVKLLAAKPPPLSSHRIDPDRFSLFRIHFGFAFKHWPWNLLLKLCKGFFYDVMRQ